MTVHAEECRPKDPISLGSPNALARETLLPDTRRENPRAHEAGIALFLWVPKAPAQNSENSEKGVRAACLHFNVPHILPEPC
jgi:hypothetical protein